MVTRFQQRNPIMAGRSLNFKMELNGDKSRLLAIRLITSLAIESNSSSHREMSLFRLRIPPLPTSAGTNLENFHAEIFCKISNSKISKEQNVPKPLLNWCRFEAQTLSYILSQKINRKWLFAGCIR